MFAMCYWHLSVVSAYFFVPLFNDFVRPCLPLVVQVQLLVNSLDVDYLEVAWHGQCRVHCGEQPSVHSLLVRHYVLIHSNFGVGWPACLVAR
jgi:hypothetical protein